MANNFKAMKQKPESTIITKFFCEMSAFFGKRLTIDESLKCAKTMTKEKLGGPDGINILFCIEN